MKDSKPIKIEKNIPLPGKVSSKESKYPFSKMEINDSFAIPYSKGGYASLYQAVRKFSKENTAYQFTIRKNIEENWIRIWRIKVKPTPEKK